VTTTSRLCAECNQPIPQKRLAALPNIRHCITCVAPHLRKMDEDITGRLLTFANTEETDVVAINTGRDDRTVFHTDDLEEIL